MGTVSACVRFSLYSLFTCIAIVGVFFLLRFRESGELKTLSFHNEFGPCYRFISSVNKITRLRGAPGIEDVAINSKGLAFLSASDKRKVQLMNTPDPSAGIPRCNSNLLGIYWIDLTQTSQKDLSKFASENSASALRKLELVNFPPNLHFHPHGISLWEDSNTSQVLPYSYPNGRNSYLS